MRRYDKRPTLLGLALAAAFAAPLPAGPLPASVGEVTLGLGAETNGIRWNGYRWNGFTWNGLDMNGTDQVASPMTEAEHRVLRSLSGAALTGPDPTGSDDALR